MNDLLIRGATVYDGTGSPGRVADVAVKGGRFAPPGPARATLDAGGLALMPGIVDVHTHYDAQVTWDPTLSPSVSLGVTTAVMGEGASTRKEPAPAELAPIRALVREALDAGAAGFASSFSPNHSGWAGQPMPSTIATDEELRTLAGELKGRGIFVMATGSRATPEFTEEISAAPGARAAIYRDPAFRARFRGNLADPKQGILFYGDWSQLEVDGVPLLRLADGKDPLEVFFDLPVDTPLVAKLYQNDDAGVAPLLKHPAGVAALSDAGAHLIYYCDAGFGLHFLAHWVRETGTFALEEGVHGVWVNGVRVHDGRAYAPLESGPGKVLRQSGARASA